MNTFLSLLETHKNKIYFFYPAFVERRSALPCARRRRPAAGSLSGSPPPGGRRGRRPGAAGCRRGRGNEQRRQSGILLRVHPGRRVKLFRRIGGEASRGSCVQVGLRYKKTFNKFFIFSVDFFLHIFFGKVPYIYINWTFALGLASLGKRKYFEQHSNAPLSKILQQRISLMQANIKRNAFFEFSQQASRLRQPSSVARGLEQRRVLLQRVRGGAVQGRLLELDVKQRVRRRRRQGLIASGARTSVTKPEVSRNS